MVLRELFAVFGVEFDDRELQQGSRSLEDTTSKLKDFAAALSAGLALNAVKDFAVETARMTNELTLASRRLGISTEGLQAWSVAAQRAGVDTDGVVDAISTLQERARDAVIDPQSDPAEQLRLLGVAARDASGELRSGQDLMLDVADALGRMDNQTDRVGAAMTLFGDVGRELLPILQQGREGFAAATRELEGLGGGLSQGAIAAGQDFTRATQRLSTAMLSLRSRVAVELLPALTRLTDGAVELLGRFFEVADKSEIVKAALVTLGVAAVATALKLIVAFLPAIAPFVGLALAIGVVALVLDDLIVSINGGRGVFGDFTDAIGDFIEMNRLDGGPLGKVARTWEALIELFEDAYDAIARVLGLDTAPDRSEFTDERGLQTPEEARRRASERERDAARGRRRARNAARILDFLPGGAPISAFEDEEIGSVPGARPPDRAELTSDEARRALRRPPERLTARATGGPIEIRQENSPVFNIQGTDIEDALRRARDQEIRERRRAAEDLADAVGGTAGGD